MTAIIPRLESVTTSRCLFHPNRADEDRSVFSCELFVESVASSNPVDLASHGHAESAGLSVDNPGSSIPMPFDPTAGAWYRDDLSRTNAESLNSEHVDQI